MGRITFITPALSQLRILHVEWMHDLSMDQLTQLLQTSPQLRHLECIDNRSLKGALDLQHVPLLQKLVLRQCPIQTLSSTTTLSLLQHVDLSSCEFSLDASLIQEATWIRIENIRMPEMRYELSRVQKLEIILHEFQPTLPKLSCPCLIHLRLQRVSSHVSWASFVKHSDTLRELEIEDWDMCSVEVPVVTITSPSLERLVIRGVKAPRHSINISCCVHLQELEITCGGEPLKHICLDRVHQLKQLVLCAAHGCGVLEMSHVKLDFPELMLDVRLHELRELRLFTVHIPQAHLRKLMSKLLTLEICILHQISSNSTELEMKSPALKKLQVNRFDRLQRLIVKSFALDMISITHCTALSYIGCRKELKQLKHKSIKNIHPHWNSVIIQ